MKALPLLLGISAFALCACGGDDHPRKPPEVPWHPATQLLDKYVTNADGSLTRAQMEAGLHRDFDAADKNKTGCLDPDETREINEQRIAADQSTATPLVDFNGRGCIDFMIFANMPRSLFATLDRDSNGVLTAQELKPWMPAPPKDADKAPSDEHHGHRDPQGGGGNGAPPGSGPNSN